MPFVSVPNCVQVGMLYSVDQQILQNSFHFQFSQAVDLAAITGLCEDVATWWAGYLRATQSESVNLYAIFGKDLTSENGLSTEITPAPPTNGAVSTTAMLPNSVTIAIKWLTALRGRSYRGRTYHIGLVESVVTMNRVNGDTLAAIVSAYETLISTVSEADRQLCVVSRYSDNALRQTGITTPIIRCSSDGIIDSQRRRLPTRGS